MRKVERKRSNDRVAAVSLTISRTWYHSPIAYLTPWTPHLEFLQKCDGA